MLDTMTRYMELMRQPWTFSLRKVLLPVCDRYSSQALTNPAMAISSGGATTAKIGASDFYASVQGTLVKVAASTTLPALTGLVITAAYFNIACFFVDTAGNLTVAFGTQGSALGLVVFPQFPQGKANIGTLLITYASTFTGGTTPLDTATTVYINAVGGSFDPTVLV